MSACWVIVLQNSHVFGNGDRAWVTKPGVDPFFAYDANYLIDNKAGIVVDAEGSRANRAVEIAVTQTMVERVQPSRLRLRPGAQYLRLPSNRTGCLLGLRPGNRLIARHPYPRPP
jgi:hypothetical protein